MEKIRSQTTKTKSRKHIKTRIVTSVKDTWKQVYG